MDTSSKQNKQGSNDFEWHTGSDGLNGYIQNISILKHQNTHSFQVHMEHSPEQITH